MAGTLKYGGGSAPNTTTRINFHRPAGATMTVLGQKDPSMNAEVGKSEVNGAGSTGPLFIANGYGKCGYKTSVPQHIWYQIVNRAKAANVPLMGEGGLVFDLITTTTVQGLEKMSKAALGASIAKFEEKISADGNMVDFEGPALNIKENGVLAFAEPS